MSSRINTILIVGGTSGIGEGFARHYHNLGKKVIITGRRNEKLSALAKELPGLRTHQVGIVNSHSEPHLQVIRLTIFKWDISNLETLQDHVTAILSTYPDLDTVFLNAGIQKSFSFFNPTKSTSEDIRLEIECNLTAPILLSRLFVPHLASFAEAGKPSNLWITSSSLAYFPLGFYPVYCPTKAAIHSFCVGLRQQIKMAGENIKNNMNLVEIVPPYTDTGLDIEHKDAVVEMQGGPEKAFPSMPLSEYLEQVFVGLEELDSGGNFKAEVGVGFGQTGVDMWRGSVGKMFETMGIEV